jgi:hypothetical protein
MKKTIAGLAVAALLSVGGYFGYTHVSENYVILNPDEQMELLMAVEKYAAQKAMGAYHEGKEACNKSI